MVKTLKNYYIFPLLLISDFGRKSDSIIGNKNRSNNRLQRKNNAFTFDRIPNRQKSQILSSRQQLIRNPFDILGLKRKTLTPDEWIYLFFLAPFKAFKPKPLEEIYVAEVDSDRPGEGKFLAELLNPEITLWISSSLTHSANFDSLVKEKNFTREEEAIAYDFGHFLEHTKKLAIVNGDNVFIQKELSRAKCPIEFTSEKDLKSWEVYKNRTEFIIDDKKYSIKFYYSESTFNPIKMTNLLMKSLKLPLDANFKNLILPPGRNSVFMGIKKTTIIDSTYNATPEG